MLQLAQRKDGVMRTLCWFSCGAASAIATKKYIRDFYKVPAKRDREVLYKGKPGVITGSDGARLRIRLHGENKSRVYHPTWEIEYKEVKDENR